MYGKYSKISNTFLFLFSNEMLVFRAGSHKMLVRIANREDPDQSLVEQSIHVAQTNYLSLLEFEPNAWINIQSSKN